MYYKGNVISSDEFKLYRYDEKVGYCNRLKYDDIFLYYGTLGLDPVKAGAELKEIILKKNKESFEGFTIRNSNIQDILDINFADINKRVFKNINTYVSPASNSIIYELFKDSEGNLYGREVFTKTVFPILTENNIQFDYSIRLLKETNDFYLIATPKTNFSNLIKCGSLITNHKVASLEEVNEYINKFGRTLKQEEISFKKHQIRLINLANQNINKKDLTINFMDDDKNGDKELPSFEASIMEDIEYSLARLKKSDIDSYQKYVNFYEKLLTRDFSRKDLELLLNKIDSLLLFEGKEIDLLSCLNQEKVNCLEYFFNNENQNKTLDFSKLDNINKLFLKTKNKYDYIEQREIIKNLAFLYLMQSIENRELLSVDMLSNTGFLMYLKTIVLWINCFKDLDFINCDMYSLDELNIEKVFEIIKSISFNIEDKEKVKELVLLKRND